MKATFFALATMAASAFAAPVAQTEVVGEVVKTVGGVVDSVGFDGVVGGLPVKRDLTDSAGLVSLLEGVLETVTGSTGVLGELTGQLQSGDISEEDANTQAFSTLEDIEATLVDLVTELTDVAGINVNPNDLTRVLTLVNGLLTVVLTNVNALVTILGITPQLTVLLRSVFSLLANVVTLVTGLVAGLLPGLIAGLSPLLAVVGNGLLAPLLTPIVALVAGIAPPLPI